MVELGSGAEAPPDMFLLELGVRPPSARSLVSSVVLHATVITLMMTVSIPIRTPELTKNELADATEIRIGNHLYYVSQISGAEKRDKPKIELPLAARAGKAGAPAPRIRPAESREPAPSAAPEPAPAIPATSSAPPAAVQAAADAAAAAARAQAARDAARRALARTFVPPEVKRSPIATQTLIQPMSPPDLVPPPTPLPSFRVMTPQFPRLNRKFVAPGRTEERPPAQVPTVVAPEIQMVQADPVATNIQPKLPLPVAPPPPDPVKAPEGPTPAPKGEPLNILSLNDRNVPLTERVVVPAGNIAQEAGSAPAPSNGAAASASDAASGAVRPNASTQTGPGTGTASSSTTAASSNGTANGAISGPGALTARGTSTAPSLANTAPGGSGLGNGPTPLPGAGAGAGASTAGNGAGAASNGLGSAREGNGRSTVGTGTGAALTGGSATGNPTVTVGGPGVSGNGTGGTGNGLSGPTVPGQLITRPPTGTFDAVVVQSSPLDQYPESRGLLTGRPIYSVYITVGAPRDWTLYYCIPNERPAPEKSDVVQLGAAQPAPIRAPYPFKMMRPQAALPSWAKYVLVHGYVNAQGRFEGMKIVRSVLPDVDRAILTSLGDWEFRAAERSGSPVMVEVLLSIPAKGL